MKQAEILFKYLIIKYSKEKAFFYLYLRGKKEHIISAYWDEHNQIWIIRNKSPFKITTVKRVIDMTIKYEGLIRV